MSRFVYTGARTGEISFPLGGIGTGCVGLAGNGALVDWEIFNRPGKGSLNGFSHFAIKAQRGRKVLDARVLNGDYPPPYVGDLTGKAYHSFGFGPARQRMPGMPHFREVVFRGEFPIAMLTFKDGGFPGRVRMTAFNPFIPLNDRDSGLPAAFFEIEVANPTNKTITYTLAGTLGNPLPGNNVNRMRRSGKLSLMHLGCDSLAADAVEYGDLALGTDAGEVSRQEYWFRGRFFDELETYWRDLTRPGALANRRYTGARAGAGTTATLAARVRVAPGRTGRVRFVVAWHFPNCENYWSRDARERAKKAGMPAVWKNYYATIWKDSAAVARYALGNWNRLYTETLRFKEALFASDLPAAALDAVSANLSVLKSPTVLRLEDGTFYGWEGCRLSAGCCEGSCTHVWNYAQALPFLFPSLERSMRNANYRYNQDARGRMRFRLQLPLGSRRSGFRPCADGQFGDVMKVYRDWKICGDTEWLRSLWPAIRKSIEFAWHPDNADRWDPGRCAVLTGRQHHTLDVELFGPNSWLNGFYLGALKAAAEMADALGEGGAAAEYRELFQKGKAWTDEHLFNGEYYHQIVDLKDKSVLKPFAAGDPGVVDAYWDSEHSEIKYQIADGCGIDQVLAQWHANLYGLGEIFDSKQTKSALRAIFRHNFKKPMRDHYNPCRVFCLNDEAGLVICTWPAGTRKPAIPLTYSQETMHGYEYAAAVQMIQNGIVREGMAVVESVRARYDGERRNPWNEIECGSNYARSMASYSLLNAFSGFEFDMTRGLVGFDPIRAPGGRFRCFWSLDGGWGEIVMTPGRAEVRVLGGAIAVRALHLPFLRAARVGEVLLGGKALAFENEKGRLALDRAARIRPGRAMVVRFTAPNQARRKKK